MNLCRSAGWRSGIYFFTRSQTRFITGLDLSFGMYGRAFQLHKPFTNWYFIWSLPVKHRVYEPLGLPYKVANINTSLSPSVPPECIAWVIKAFQQTNLSTKWTLVSPKMCENVQTSPQHVQYVELQIKKKITYIILHCLLCHFNTYSVIHSFLFTTAT